MALCLRPDRCWYSLKIVVLISNQLTSVPQDFSPPAVQVPGSFYRWCIRYRRRYIWSWYSDNQNPLQVSNHEWSCWRRPNFEALTPWKTPRLQNRAQIPAQKPSCSNYLQPPVFPLPRWDWSTPHYIAEFLPRMASFPSSASAFSISFGNPLYHRVCLNIQAYRSSRRTPSGPQMHRYTCFLHFLFVPWSPEYITGPPSRLLRNSHMAPPHGYNSYHSGHSQ